MCVGGGEGEGGGGSFVLVGGKRVEYPQLAEKSGVEVPGEE